MIFADKLIDAILEKDNPTVAGLDPKYENLPAPVRVMAEKKFGTGDAAKGYAFFEFGKAIIDAIYDIVPAIKPQLAYYELLGPAGMEAFAKTVKYASSKGMLTIADGKRNDIGSTAENYAEAYLGPRQFNADALTVNPYLGDDGIRPFADLCERYDRGIFLLVKTSNKSSGRLQDLMTSDGMHIYEKVAELVNDFAKNSTIGKHGYSSVGAVVGATYPEQAKTLRGIMKRSILLVPGYGAQGGAASDAAVNFDKDGLGAIVNASRSIIYAYASDRWKNSFTEERFAEASRAECKRMRDELNLAIRGK
jgi:orotidine-5'-phosphate decarboxylase